MDFIRKYDIELEKEYYYAGEVVRGCVALENLETLRVNGIQVYLRGKAHVEWRITRGGERRTVKEEQFFIDDKAIIWGKETTDDGSSGCVLAKGDHRFPFEFHLPNTSLPCSFESRIGSVRYYLRVVVDIPYKSPPQGLKYFTIIGPYIDSLDAKYMSRQTAFRQKTSRCLWCVSSPVSLEVSLDRSSYCCGQHIKVQCEVQNGSDQAVTLICRLVQEVDYRISKGSVAMNKEASHSVLELQSQPIQPHTADVFQDLDKHLRVPVMPPSMHDVCKLIEIAYILRISLYMGKSEEELQADFSIIISTVPHQILSNELTEIAYEPADDRVEGGNYISPEFQLGQVYDGESDVVADVILYRPVYVCIQSRQESQSVDEDGPSPPHCDDPGSPTKHNGSPIAGSGKDTDRDKRREGQIKVIVGDPKTLCSSVQQLMTSRDGSTEKVHSLTAGNLDKKGSPLASETGSKTSLSQQQKQQQQPAAVHGSGVAL